MRNEFCQQSVVQEPCCPMLVDSSDTNTNPALQYEILFDDEKLRLEIRFLELQCEQLSIENEKKKVDIKISQIDAVMKFQAAMTSLVNWEEEKSLVQQTQEVLKNGFFGKYIQNDSLLVVTAIHSVVNS